MTFDFERARRARRPDSASAGWARGRRRPRGSRSRPIMPLRDARVWSEWVRASSIACVRRASCWLPRQPPTDSPHPRAAARRRLAAGDLDVSAPRVRATPPSSSWSPTGSRLRATEAHLGSSGPALCDRLRAAGTARHRSPSATAASRWPTSSRPPRGRDFVHLIGERPGLASPDSLGCYVTLHAGPQHDPTIASASQNIRALRGLDPTEAGATIAASAVASWSTARRVPDWCSDVTRRVLLTP